MGSLKLIINSRVDIKVGDNIYKTVIQDTKGDSFSISVPINNGEYLTIQNGEVVELTYLDDKNNLYRLTCKVLKKLIEDKIPMYCLAMPHKVQKIQRRNFVRVGYISPVRLGKVTHGDIKRIMPGNLIDISGGGIRVKAKEKVNLNDRLYIHLNVEGCMFEVSGDIVRVEKSEDGRFIYGLRFVNLENGLREKIIQLIFKIMRKQRELL